MHLKIKIAFVIVALLLLVNWLNNKKETKQLLFTEPISAFGHTTTEQSVAPLKVIDSVQFRSKNLQISRNTNLGY